jgi:hypothetical protein
VCVAGVYNRGVSGWFAPAWGREKGDVLVRRGRCEVGGEKYSKIVRTYVLSRTGPV